jgi:tRNA pseudouridine38-40 synthase
MYYYKTKISYEGTNYAGFQWQKDLKTIQSEFNLALSQITIGKFTTTAASRTDTGVHAFEQFVKITCENPIELSNFASLFNNSLPRDIKSHNIEICDGIFHPSAHAVSKEYRYFFTNKKSVPTYDRQFIANSSHALDLVAIEKCVQALLGEHDFCNFFSSGSNVKSSVRKIILCEFSEINPHQVFSENELFKLPSDLESCFQLRIIANGFLKQMIRHIVSALWMVGSGKLSFDEFITLLNGQKNEKQMWKVATPVGLYLYKINYTE